MMALNFWTFSCVCFQSPEGRKENSPGLQPWERDEQRNRPESTPSPPCGRFSASAFGKDCLTRASELGSAGNEEHVVIRFDGPVSFTPNCARSLPREMPSIRFRKTLPLEITPGSRPPFQGDSLSVRIPRAEALGYSLFALRAVENASPKWSGTSGAARQLPCSNFPPATPLQRSLAKLLNTP